VTASAWIVPFPAPVAIDPTPVGFDPTPVAIVPTPVGSPGPTISPPSCQHASEICQYIWDHTQQRWLAESSYYLVVKPVTILVILLSALIVRFVLHRMIKRLAKASGEGMPSLLRPLRERIPESMQETTTGARVERRRQRAEALGSVLRSIASVTVLTIAALWVLGEIGFDLAPLLASAGVAGVAIGFGAQNLVKDFLSGLFMLLEDQYGVGDVVDLGPAVGTVEAVGLRITTIRDVRGVLWYIRNGEINRVGNKSQGWAQIVLDVPIGFAGVEEATGVLRAAVRAFSEDPEVAHEFLEPPEVLGVEQITVDGAVIRIIARTASDNQWRLAREMRRRLTDALESAGIAQQMTGARIFVRPAAQEPAGPVPDPGLGAPTDT
jgi:moderate conductance mechanosensitive channel